MKSPKIVISVIVFAMLVLAVAALTVNAAASPLQAFKAPKPKFTQSIANDLSPALRNLAKKAVPQVTDNPDAESVDIRPDRGPIPVDKGFSGDGAVSAGPSSKAAVNSAIAIPSPLVNFEGVSNQDNFNLFGFRVNPPDPVGDVGPNH